MARFFSRSARSLNEWLGYDRHKLPSTFKKAVETYAQNGAVKKVGEIESIQILDRSGADSPVHQSHYNRKDKAWIVSARITPANGRTRTHHIYEDGTGTFKVGDRREYSTSRREASSSRREPDRRDHSGSRRERERREGSGSRRERDRY